MSDRYAGMSCVGCSLAQPLPKGYAAGRHSAVVSLCHFRGFALSHRLFGFHEHWTLLQYLAQVISLVGWPMLVKVFFFFFFCSGKDAGDDDCAYPEQDHVRGDWLHS